ncbi:MAG: GntR family transcriptional regulator [Actinobacteria bacterium]|nr:GntR family transcriptional regulator [Actinomycetota bacterium]
MAADRRPFRRPPTAQQAVLAELRAMISAGELKPGDQLRQEHLAERLGVSRLPVREALRALAAEGQASYTPHRGYFVAQLSVAELTECYRVRELLEEEAVRLAVPRMSDADIAGLAQAIDEMDRADAAGDLVAVAAANRRYHFTLYRGAGMARLVDLIRIMWDATDVYRSRYFAEPAHRRALNDEHRAVLAAVRDRDPDTAVRLLAEHRAHTLDTLTTLLATTEATP